MDLPLVKQHLKVELDDTAEDGLIQGYVSAALAHVEQHCDRVLVDGDPSGPEEMALTKDVEQAVLLIVGHWYAHREAVVTGTISTVIPLGAERLLWYRKRF